MAMQLLSALFLAVAATADPIPIGLVATRTAAADASGHAFALEAGRQCDAFSAPGGRASIRLVVEDDAGTEEGAKAAIARLAEQGVVAIVGPLDAGLADAAERAAVARKIPIVPIAPPMERVVNEIDRTIRERLRAVRIGLITDKDRSTKELKKSLAARLPHPYEIVVELDVGLGKALLKRLESNPPVVLVVDATAPAVRAAIDECLGTLPLPILLTPRAVGDALIGMERDVFAILPRSLATVPGGSPFLKEFRRTHGEPGYGVAEALDATSVLLDVIGRVESPTRDAIARGLDATKRQGPRGAVEVSTTPARLDLPLAVWHLHRGVPVPYLPAPIPAELIDQGTAALRDVDPTLGVPFATYRTDRFELEEDTQWVLFTFGQAEESTIDEDLRAIGLSTGGSHPLVDHLVKEEILARLMAINSLKFLRNEDGTAIPGKSLKISFATHLPPKARLGRGWIAVVAGDDEFAGGRAYPGQGRAEIYSTFIRRTIYEPHALDPPVGSDDLTYLDGSYRFGTDRARDRRSELIRALINGYAGSMALTAAHELGHLAGLDHITDDPYGIMNVEEGAGIDHDDGRFTPFNLEKLVKRLGVVPEPKKR